MAHVYQSIRCQANVREDDGPYGRSARRLAERYYAIAREGADLCLVEAAESG
jgi:hypothetical protein